MDRKVLLIATNQTEACGLRYLASSLSIDNIKTYIIYYFDGPPENLDILNQFIEKNNVGIIGISVFSSLKQTAILITESLKKKYNMPIVWGGPHVNSDPEDAIIYADIIGLHDCEIPFRNLVKKLFKGEDIKDINNFWFKNDNAIIKNPVEIIEDIDLYPFPDWDTDNKFLIKDGKIEIEKESPAKNWYRVFCSRGCPFECSYCANKVIKMNSGAPSKYYRVRRVDSIILEIENAVRKFPSIRHIAFYDELFGVKDKWVEEFCQKYSERIRIPFGLQSNPVILNTEKIKKLKSAGLKDLGFGLQTASERMRKIYKRPETLTKIKEMNLIGNKFKIVHQFDIIVDNPLENKEDLTDTLKYLLTLKKPFLSKTFDLEHLPKTDLTEKLLNERHITDRDIAGNKGTQYYAWRIDKERLGQKQQGYIIALIQLTGNALIPNWIIKKMLLLDDKNSDWFKNKVKKIVLNERFYKISAIINNAVMMRKSLLIKKIIRRLVK